MIRKVAGVLIALACVSMTFGQSAQTKAQSIIGRTQSLIKQGTSTTQNVVRSGVVRSQGAIQHQATTTTQIPYQNAAQTIQPQQYQSLGTVDSRITQPTATTTPHEVGSTVTQPAQNFQEYPVQEFQSQAYPVQQSQPQQFYYNNNGNYNNRQFQPIRRVWNFTRNIFN